MKEFIRSDEYMGKIFIDALDNDAKLDVDVRFERANGKIKAYCPQTRTYLQFPTALRRLYISYKADVIKATNKNCRTFYRVYKGSIRDSEGNVVG